MPHASGMIESGLSVDPEDLGREFLAHATDQDNFESLAAGGGRAVELDEPAADDAIPAGAFSDDPEFWGRTIDVAMEEGSSESDLLDELDGFDTRDGIDDESEDEEIEDDDLGELGTTRVIGNLGEYGDGDVEGYIDLDDDELIEVLSVEQLDVLALLTVLEIEALGPPAETGDAEAAANERRADQGRAARKSPPPVPTEPPPHSGRKR